MHWIALVVLLAVLQYMVFGMMVGRARMRYQVLAPATVGHPQFERLFRVHYNTLELLVAFIPSIWLFGLYLDPRWGAGIGAIFVLGRAVYAFAYIRAPQRREVGAMMSFASVAVLLFGALFGAVRLLWE